MTTITTLITLPPDLVERDRVRRQAQRAGAIRHPGLAALRDVSFSSEGLVLTWDVPGEDEDVRPDAVSLLAPVAAGLALLHDAGVAHGGVRESAIHVCDGRGVLTGWRPGGTAADDVRDLVAILETWLPPASVGADVAQIIIRAHDPDPSVRPSMARLAAVLDRAACVGAPVASPPAHRRARTSMDGPSPVAVAPVVPVPGGAARGRHALRRAPQVSAARGWRLPRLPLRWGVAIVGAALAGFIGLSTLGAAGSAPGSCPAVMEGSAWMSLVERAMSR